MSSSTVRSTTADDSKPLSSDDTQRLYWDVVFCAHNINNDGSPSEFLSTEELERVYTTAAVNQSALNLYIEDKNKLNNNWNKLQKLYLVYQAVNSGTV